MFIKPMLLQEIQQQSLEQFNDVHWITELKFDGMRLLVSQWDKTQLYSRHRQEWTHKFPELLNLDLPNQTILDGELISPGLDGKPDFEALMSRLHQNQSTKPIVFCCFDVLYYKGKSLFYQPLINRKEILHMLFPKNHEHLIKVPYLKGHALDYFNVIKNQGLEGICIKKEDSTYMPGSRSNSWYKVVSYKEKVVWITGYSRGKFMLSLSFVEGGPAGGLQFMTPADRKFFFSIATQRIIDITENWIVIQPILCKVKYRNITQSGKLRLPVFIEFLL